MTRKHEVANQASDREDLILLTPSPSNDNAALGDLQYRSRFGGLLEFDRREAA
jgi:hypothetical protein